MYFLTRFARICQQFPLFLPSFFFCYTFLKTTQEDKHHGKIAPVTGSSRGIGRAVAAELARQSWAVCINYRPWEDCARSLLEQLTGRGRRAMMVQPTCLNRIR